MTKHAERQMEILAAEVDELREINAELSTALTDVMGAALKQLAYMGKGVPPSPNLRAAIDRANAALAKGGVPK